MTLNLEDFVDKEVLVTYCDDDTIGKGVIEKNYLDTPFPFIFRCLKTGVRYSYTKNGQFYSSKKSQIDIVKIQLAEPEMTEPNYKELSE